MMTHKRQREGAGEEQTAPAMDEDEQMRRTVRMDAMLGKLKATEADIRDAFKDDRMCTRKEIVAYEALAAAWRYFRHGDAVACMRDVAVEATSRAVNEFEETTDMGRLMKGLRDLVDMIGEWYE